MLVRITGADGISIFQEKVVTGFFVEEQAARLR
jgi:hypothetical protein